MTSGRADQLTNATTQNLVLSVRLLAKEINFEAIYQAIVVAGLIQVHNWPFFHVDRQT